MKRCVFMLAILIGVFCVNLRAEESDLYVPNQIAVVYVILQKPGELVDGSSELLALVNRDEFIRDFQKYVNTAKSKNIRLIITAATSGENQWLHGKIKYKGRYLKPAMYRDPNQSKSFPGVEIPLE